MNQILFVRNMIYGIENPRTLSWYQEAQLNVIKTYREKRENES